MPPSSDEELYCNFSFSFYKTGEENLTQKYEIIVFAKVILLTSCFHWNREDEGNTE
jgi:hypothetical protein